jgi:hypothetical protein
MEIWIVSHIPPADGDGVDTPLLIGLYSSLEAAHLAVGRLCVLPGFRDHPDISSDADSAGFFVEAYRLDEDHWTSGFRRADD